MTAKEMQALQTEANNAFKDPATRLSKNMTIHRQRYINKNKNESNAEPLNWFKKGGKVKRPSKKKGVARGCGKVMENRRKVTKYI